jgi:leader peptidase (prepilin peptidase)/N-methyltransferase
LLPLPPALDRSSLLFATLVAGLTGIGGLFWLPAAAAAATAALAFSMSLITFTDLRYFLVPDVVSMPAIAGGVVANTVVFHGGDWQAGMLQSMIGAGLAAGAFYLLRAAYSRLRGVEGLGLGDVKLAAVAGTWLGYEPLPMLVLVAAVAALVAVLLRAFANPGAVVEGGAAVPFGGFLAPAILLFWLWRLAGFASI